MTSLWQLKRFEARIPLFKSLDCPLALAAAGMNQRFTRYPPVINHNLGWCNYINGEFCDVITIHVHLQRGFNYTDGFPSQRASNVERFSMSRRNHAGRTERSCPSIFSPSAMWMKKAATSRILPPFSPSAFPAATYSPRSQQWTLDNAHRPTKSVMKMMNWVSTGRDESNHSTRTATQML